MSGFDLPNDSLDDLYAGAHTAIPHGVTPRLYVRGAKTGQKGPQQTALGAQSAGEVSDPSSSQSRRGVMARGDSGSLARPKGGNRERMYKATWGGGEKQDPSPLPLLEGNHEMPETAPRPKPQLTLESWRPVVKNTLRGFASVRLPVGGGTALIIKELSVHRKGDYVWVGFPAKPRISQGGQVMKDQDGKIQYDNLIQWTEKEHGDLFSARVVELIKQFHPTSAP